jgi:uncharacterized protein (DUF1697 family)
MPRYVAFLRGVSPLNAKMPELKRCFEEAGFRNVKTVLSSGNVVFDAASASEPSLERKVEAYMQATLGRTFYTIIRNADDLRLLLESNPYSAFSFSPDSKRVVSFLRVTQEATPKLPIESDGASVLSVVGREVFTAYVPSPNGPVFMKLLEKAFGTQITTRTWETVKKCASA